MRRKNNTKKSKSVIILLMLSLIFSIILVSASVSALKISPAVKNYNLETMNSHEEYSNNVLESKGKISYELKTSNKELLKFVSLEKEGNKIIVSIDKPNIELPEGNNLVEILVKESGNEKEQMFSGNIILKSKLNFLKPINGAFLESNYVIQNNDFDDPVIFTISLNNKGTSKVDAQGSVIVKNNPLSNIKVHEEVPLSEATLEMNERGKVAKTWNHDLRRGSYESKATLIYSGKTKEFEKAFSIGNPTILFKKVYINDYSKNGISRIKAKVELDWNLDKQVFLEINGEPSNTQGIIAYGEAEYDLYVDNIDSLTEIEVVAKDSDNKVLSKNSYNVKELIKDYNHRFYWKIGIIGFIIILLAVLVFWQFFIKNKFKNKKLKDKKPNFSGPYINKN